MSVDENRLAGSIAAGATSLKSDPHAVGATPIARPRAHVGERAQICSGTQLYS